MMYVVLYEQKIKLLHPDYSMLLQSGFYEENKSIAAYRVFNSSDEAASFAVTMGGVVIKALEVVSTLKELKSGS